LRSRAESTVINGRAMVGEVLFILVFYFSIFFLALLVTIVSLLGFWVLARVALLGLKDQVSGSEPCKRTGT
jgi:hypothetical protein